MGESAVDTSRRRDCEKMPKETEIKLRVKNLRALRSVLKKLRAQMIAGPMHEHNTIFDTPEFDLAKQEHLLRIRTETARSSRGRHGEGAKRALVTFKRPLLAAGTIGKERHKVREEIELEASDHRALAKIFEGLGMRGWFQYEKLRTTFRLPHSQAWAKRLLIELDDTPIGLFLELEGTASAIDRAAKALGFLKSDYILANYMVLYREYCQRRGEQPTDMLFAKKKQGARPSKRKNFS